MSSTFLFFAIRRNSIKNSQATGGKRIQRHQYREWQSHRAVPGPSRPTETATRPPAESPFLFRGTTSIQNRYAAARSTLVHPIVRLPPATRVKSNPRPRQQRHTIASFEPGRACSVKPLPHLIRRSSYPRSFFDRAVDPPVVAIIQN